MRFDLPRSRDLPSWVPQSVARYVAHTEHGLSIRELARRDGCHASTVLRQIRKLEIMRDDPMIDAALERFRASSLAEKGRNAKALAVAPEAMPEAATLQREARRILARLCETGAVLAVAQGMENAVVVRDMPKGETLRTATVAQGVSQAMALKDWIQSNGKGKVRRYCITAGGRAELNRQSRQQRQARATRGSIRQKVRWWRCRGAKTKTACRSWTRGWLPPENGCGKILSWRRWGQNTPKRGTRFCATRDGRLMKQAVRMRRNWPACGCRMRSAILATGWPMLRCGVVVILRGWKPLKSSLAGRHGLQKLYCGSHWDG